MGDNMIRRRYTGLVSPLVIDDSHVLAQIPRLPFLEGHGDPPCAELDELFELAGDDSRIDSDRRQRAVKAAERGAKSICAACPALLACRAYAIATRQEWGVWGGTNPAERREYVKQHGRHAWDEVEAMGPEELRRKFEDVPTIELFSSEAYTRTDQNGERTRHTTQRAIAYGNCPSCTKRPTAVVVQGKHWVWRAHYYRTWGSEKRQCAASNVALCVAPEPAGNSHAGEPLTCPHGPTSPADEHVRAAA
jgi:hypothetical protein